MNNKPTILSLDDYLGIPVKPITIVTSEAAVDARVSELLEKVAVAQPVATPIQRGDIVALSWDAHLGKKSFPGSRGSTDRLEVGSGAFIDGFEEKLLGHRAHDELDFTLNFPSNHIREELQGRRANFHVVINEVFRKPELTCTDECVREVSEFESVEELRQAIRDQMDAENADEMSRHMRSCLMDALAQRATVEIPDSFLEEQTQEALSDLKETLESQGQTFSSYCENSGKSESEVEEDMRRDVHNGIAATLALEEIVRREGLEVTKEDLRQEASQLARMTEEDPESFARALEDDSVRSAMTRNLLQNKALDFILDNAVFVDEFDAADNGVSADISLKGGATSDAV